MLRPEVRLSDDDEAERQRFLKQAREAQVELEAKVDALKTRWDEVYANEPRRSPALPLRTIADYAVPALCAGVVWFFYGLPFGALAGLFGYLAMINLPAGTSGGSSRAGTVAWEAEMAVGLLDNVINAKVAERESLTGEAAARADRELAFLRAQRTDKRAVAASGDPSPGEGYVAYQTYEGP